MRKLIIKDYIVRKGLEFNFKINCLTSKSIGGRKEEYPCMYVCVCICTYIFHKKPFKQQNRIKISIKIAYTPCEEKDKVNHYKARGFLEEVIFFKKRINSLQWTIII